MDVPSIYRWSSVACSLQDLLVVKKLTCCQSPRDCLKALGVDYITVNKTVLNIAIVSALSAVAFSPTASAAAVANGNYLAIINPTPMIATEFGTVPDFGTDGAWNSSWSAGSHNAPTTTSSQRMTDNSTTISTPSGTRGSSMLGNGAGSFNISLSGGSFTATGFQVDAVFGTPGSTFVQYGSIVGGTVTGTGGMTLDVTGRLGAFSGSFPSPGSLRDERWNVNDFNSNAGGGTVLACDNQVGANCLSNGNTTYTSFTTGAVQNGMTQGNSISAGFLNANAITGAEAVSLGDINGDGLSDYRFILVSASHMGSNWGGFIGAGYLETWNINLLSQIPIPATAWLFGSGLMGLSVVARLKRRRK